MATAEQKKKWKKQWRDAKIEQGLCSQCGKEPLISKWYCVKCLRRIRNYFRKQKGFLGWSPGRRGTVPFEHRKGPITFPKNFSRGLKLVRVNHDGLTAYYRAIRQGSPFKGAWITVRIEERTKPQAMTRQKHG
jgi:hypothetical protein